MVKTTKMMTTRSTQTTNSMESKRARSPNRFIVSHRKRQTSGVPDRIHKDEQELSAVSIPRITSTRHGYGTITPRVNENEIGNRGPRPYQVLDKHSRISRAFAYCDKTSDCWDITDQVQQNESVRHRELSDVDILRINSVGIEPDDAIVNGDAVTTGDTICGDASTSDLFSWNASDFSYERPELHQSYGNNRRNLYALLVANADGISVNSECIDSDSRLYENWNAYQESGDHFPRSSSIYDIPGSVYFECLTSDRVLEDKGYLTSVKCWMGDLKCEDYEDEKGIIDPLLQKYPSDLGPASRLTSVQGIKDNANGNLKDFDNILRDLGDAIASLEPQREPSNEFSSSLLDIFDELLYTNNFENSECTSSNDSAVGLNNNSYELACKLNPRCHFVDLNRMDSIGNISNLSDEVFLTPDRSMSCSPVMDVETPTDSMDFEPVEMRCKTKRVNCASWDIKDGLFNSTKEILAAKDQKRNKSLNDVDYIKFIMEFADYSVNRKLNDDGLEEKVYQEIWKCRSSEAPPLPPRGLLMKQYYAELRVQSTLFESMSDIPILIIDKPTPETVRVCSIREDPVENEEDSLKNVRKYSDENVENCVKKFRSNDYVKNSEVNVFENLFVWKRLLKCEEYFDDEEHEWMVVDPELLQENRSLSQDLVIPKIIPTNNSFWTTERLAFKKELQNKLGPSSLPNAWTTPKLQVFHDNETGLELRNKTDPGRRKQYAVSTISPSTTIKKSSLEKSTFNVDVTKVRYKADVLKKKIHEGGKKGKNWQNNFVIVTDTSLIFWKDRHAFHSHIPAQNSPIKSPKLGSSSRHPPELVLPLQDLDISYADENVTSKEGALRLLIPLGQIVFPEVQGVLIRTERIEDIDALLMEICRAADIKIPDAPLATSSSTEDFAKKSPDTTKSGGSTEYLDREQARFNLLRWFKKRPAMDTLVKKGIIQGTIFGGSLEVLCPPYGIRVPPIVRACTDHLENTPGFMEADGLYRASANLSMIQRLRIQLNQGVLDAIHEEEDPHVIAGTLKLFFRELKEPLIPFSAFEGFLEASGIRDLKERVHRLRDLVHSLPTCNRDTLQHVVAHLVRVTECKEANRMHVGNLAIVWGPSLMWKAPEDTESGDAPRSPSAVCYDIAVHCFQQNMTIELLITNHEQIFL